MQVRLLPKNPWVTCLHLLPHASHPWRWEKSPGSSQTSYCDANTKLFYDMHELNARWMMKALAVSWLSPNLSRWQSSTPVSLRGVRWIAYLIFSEANLVDRGHMKQDDISTMLLCTIRWPSWRVFPIWKSCHVVTFSVTPWSGLMRLILTAAPGFLMLLTNN